MTPSPRTIMVVAFVATFAAGAATMKAVDRWFQRARTSAAAGGWTDVAEKLELTSAQREQAELIFARYQPSTDSLIISLAPRLAAVSDSMQHDIELLLTPDQRVKLKALQRPAAFLLRRKSLGGSRVDTLRIP